MEGGMKWDVTCQSLEEKDMSFLWSLFFIIPVLQRLMTRFSIYFFIFCTCWSDAELPLRHELLEFGVFLWSDESLFCLQFTMSGICRHLFYKMRACGGYWLFVSSRWTRVFWRVFTSTSCDIRTSLTWAGRYKSTSRSRVCIFTKLS